MLIQKYSLGQLQANCYFIIQDNECMVIDPADEAEFILEKIQRENLTLTALFATHGHFDHVMAVGEIQLSYDVPLYIHEADLFLIKRLSQTAKHFLGYEPIVIEPKRVEFFNENINSQFSPFNFQYIHTPGHTPGGSCFYFPNEEALFTGDTLFKDAVGRTDLSYSSRNDLKKSLNKIAKLPEDTIVYPGHGDETTIDEENLL